MKRRKTRGFSGLIAIGIIFLIVFLISRNESVLNKLKGFVSGSTVQEQQSATYQPLPLNDPASSETPPSTDGSLTNVAEVVELNGNVPYFTDEEKQVRTASEFYSDLDELGRCGVVYLVAGKETMPPEGASRGEIGNIKPTGWQQARYPKEITGTDSEFLWNRCHLSAWCLSNENDNPKNLITGTRYFNNYLMLPYETKVADYIDKTNNHVLYRVSPDFQGNNLVASGIRIEAWSLEDNGTGICFNVYIKNVEHGVVIDYATGFSSLAEGVQQVGQ